MGRDLSPTTGREGSARLRIRRAGLRALPWLVVPLLPLALSDVLAWRALRGGLEACGGLAGVEVVSPWALEQVGLARLLAPWQPHATLVEAVLRLRAGHGAEALALLRSPWPSGTPHPLAWLDEAREGVGPARFASLDPGDARAPGLGLLAWRRGDAKAARLASLRSAGLEGQSLAYHLLRGLLEEAQGRLDVAQAELERAALLRFAHRARGGWGLGLSFSTGPRDAVPEIAPVEVQNRLWAAESLLHLARVQRARGRVKTSILSARLAEGSYGRLLLDRGLESWLLDALHPRAFREQVESAASLRGLEPELLWAVMREESRFEPTARSRAGASGLMQLMPSTARWGAARAGLAPGEGTWLEDPDTNIRIGAWYLAYLRDALPLPADEWLPWLLAAYNAGEGRVRSWLAGGGGGSGERRFPFAETNAYVERVLASYAVYRRLERSAARSAELAGIHGAAAETTLDEHEVVPRH